MPAKSFGMRLAPHERRQIERLAEAQGMNMKDAILDAVRRQLDELDELAGYRGRLVTCEAVLSEAWFLAQSQLSPPESLLSLLERLPLEVVPGWGQRALEYVWQYRDQPMDVADACLVALAGEEASGVVVTIDFRDFSVYRLHDGRSVPVLMPPA